MLPYNSLFTVDSLPLFDMGLTSGEGKKLERFKGKLDNIFISVMNI
jgi:hypothetical protein